jgi:glyoxylase-like metal-dependent hydrolase (beta-lactamase superfamily II)
MKTFLIAALAAAFATHAQAADVELWRLDCGHIHVHDLGVFSDTGRYAGQQKTLTDSCYLVRHGVDYMLWDTGLPATLLGAKVDPAAAFSPALDRDLPSQLKVIGVTPDRIKYLGISHNHFDHMGQMTSFGHATLLMGKADFDALKSGAQAFAVDPSLAAPWLKGEAKADPVSGDRDIFGDGSVVMLAMPGHTAGETALLVRLPKTGAVLLSGDVAHFEAQVANNGVPSFNADRADSLASLDRLKGIAATLHAVLIVQHDPADIAKLPAFPKSAK